MAKADEAHDMENPSLKAWGYSRTWSIIHSHSSLKAWGYSRTWSTIHSYPQPEGIELWINPQKLDQRINLKSHNFNLRKRNKYGKNKKTVYRRTLRAILKQADTEVEDFIGKK